MKLAVLEEFKLDLFPFWRLHIDYNSFGRRNLEIQDSPPCKHLHGQDLGQNSLDPQCHFYRQTKAQKLI